MARGGVRPWRGGEACARAGRPGSAAISPILRFAQQGSTLPGRPAESGARILRRSTECAFAEDVQPVAEARADTGCSVPYCLASGEGSAACGVADSRRGFAVERRSSPGGFAYGRRSAGEGFEASRHFPVNGFGPSKRSAVDGSDAPKHSAVNGFTLVELLVALFIFALLSAAGVMLLGNAVSAQGAVGQRLDEQGGLVRVVALLEQDMAQAVPRVSRTESGLLAPAFFARTPSPDAPFLQFVRGGWSNPDDAPRADLAKVEYWLRDGRLERRVYPAVDGAAGGDPADLLDRIENIAPAFRDAKGQWSDEWQQPGPKAMPVAMRLTIVRRGAAPLTLLFRVGAGPQKPDPVVAPAAANGAAEAGTVHG